MVWGSLSSCPSSSFCGVKTLGQTRELRVAITEMLSHGRSLLLAQAAQGPFLEVATAVRVPLSRQGLIPLARKGQELSWMRMGIWTW